MSDVKDILGVPRDGTPAQAAPVPKKEKLKRPEGMSREAFALLSGGLNPLAPTALAEQLKKKDFKQLAKSKRTSSKGIVTYQWMPFTNPGRTDGLQLSHWVKCYKDRANVITPANKGEYPFAKYNVKVCRDGMRVDPHPTSLHPQQAPVSRYNDEEWSNLIAADPEWTREETDYLLDLCEALALKFFVIADRYNVRCILLVATRAACARTVQGQGTLCGRDQGTLLCHRPPAADRAGGRQSARGQPHPRQAPVQPAVRGQPQKGHGPHHRQPRHHHCA